MRSQSIQWVFVLVAINVSCSPSQRALPASAGPSTTPGIATAPAQTAAATKLLGATHVMDSLTRSATPTEEQQPAGPLNSFVADVNTYLKDRGGLSPSKSAEVWVTLSERYFKEVHPLSMGSGGAGREARSAYDRLWGALPEPAAWPHLHAAFSKVRGETAKDARRLTGLRLVAGILARDEAAIRKEVSELERVLVAAGHSKAQAQGALDTLRLALSEMGLMSGVAHQNELERALRAGTDDSGYGYGQSIVLPALDLTIGETKARELIVRALKTKGILLGGSDSPSTQELTRKVALEHVSEMVSPQWALVKSTKDRDLYLAMRKRFADEQTSQGQAPYDRARADTLYVASLVESGQVPEAVIETKALLARQPEIGPTLSAAFRQLDEHGRESDALKFYQALSLAQLDGALWEDYAARLASAGQGKQVVSLLRTQLEKTDPSDGKRRAHLTRVLIEALLHQDMLDDAWSLILASVRAPAMREALGGYGTAFVETMAWAGVRLQSSTWLDQALAELRVLSGSVTSNRYDVERLGLSICRLLVAAKRDSAAEQCLLDRMALKVREHTGEDGQILRLNAELTELVLLYDRNDRPADVLTLLEKAPWWGYEDLFGLKRADLVVSAAKGLHHAGQGERAVALLERQLWETPGHDASYQQLLIIDPAHVAQRLETIYARDRFEERPLLWLAEVMRSQGKIAEAESYLRRAIEVDPGDGEEPADDRLRAYAMLADVLTAPAKKEEADTLRSVVSAVRLADSGDKLRDLGLSARALATYQQAEQLFAGAYCVEWRLGDQLSRAGRPAEAKKHYEKAFTVMPGQFGRVSNLCFGCEGIFARPMQREVANDALSRAIAAAPTRPQLFYLRAKLRSEQGRAKEAYDDLSRATQLDQDYLDAWNDLLPIAKSIERPRKELDALRLRILTLDPLQRHSSAEHDEITDLVRLWDALGVSEKIVENAPKATFPFQQPSQRTGMHEGMFDGDRRGARGTRGNAIAQLPLISAVMGMVLSGM